MNLRQAGVLYPAPSTAALPRPAPFGSRPFRVRATAVDRNYRRAVRAAEMTAWNAAPPANTAFLRARTLAADRVARIERRLINLLLGLTAGLAIAAWSLAAGGQLEHGWRQVVSLVRRVLG